MKKAGTFGHTNPEVRKTVHLATFSGYIIWKLIKPVGLMKLILFTDIASVCLNI